MNLTVFVCGPYTAPDDRTIRANVERALEVGDAIEGLGLVAFVPHLAHWRDLQHRRSRDGWLRIERIWLTRCDAMFRLPGDSVGGAEHEAEAARRGIPVFRDMVSLLDWASAQSPERSPEPGGDDELSVRSEDG